MLLCSLAGCMLGPDYERPKQEMLEDYRHSDVVETQDAVRLARLKYFGGVLSYLDLLDAQRRLFEGEVSLSEANRNRLVALVLLYKALGGGWGAETEQEIARRAGGAR